MNPVCKTCELAVLGRCEASGQLIRSMTSCPKGLWRQALPTTDLVVDVVITSHNYGRFLQECIDSVSQQVSLGQIVLVNDASTDNTDSFAGQVDQYLEISEGHVQAARQAGIALTTSPFVLYMDADNKLPKGYISSSLQRFLTNPRLAICYSDMALFGDEVGIFHTAKVFDRARLELENYIDTCSVIRKEALLQTGCLATRTLSHDDWYMWQQVMSSGEWEAEYQPLPLSYRIHADQAVKRHRKDSYSVQRNFQHETITLFTTFSRRVADNMLLWQRRLEWIEEQSWPKDRLRLVVANTSGEEHPNLPQNLAGISVYNHSLPVGLESAPRLANEQLVQTVVAAIYNRAFQECSTRLIMTMEDDVFCDWPDALSHMVSLLDNRTVGVTGAYKLRYPPYTFSHWLGKQKGCARPETKLGTGVVNIGGCGFGFVLLRKDLLCLPFYGNSENSPYYDQDFWYRMGDKYKLKLDWGIYCDHVGDGIV